MFHFILSYAEWHKYINKKILIELPAPDEQNLIRHGQIVIFFQLIWTYFSFIWNKFCPGWLHSIAMPCWPGEAFTPELGVYHTARLLRLQRQQSLAETMSPGEIDKLFSYQSPGPLWAGCNLPVWVCAGWAAIRRWAQLESLCLLSLSTAEALQRAGRGQVMPCTPLLEY